MLRPMGQVLNLGGMELGWGQGAEGRCGGGSRARSALPKDPVTSGQGATEGLQKCGSSREGPGEETAKGWM